MSKNSAKQNITQVIAHLKAKGLWKKAASPSRRTPYKRSTVKSN